MQPSGYSRRTLSEKLGLRPGMRACLLHDPEGYRAALDDALAPVDLVPTLDGAAGLDFIHLFVRSRADLAALLPRTRAALASSGMLWVSWPKKAARLPTDLDENGVRELGIASGLVDVKVVAIDSVWSALKFVYRLRDR